MDSPPDIVKTFKVDGKVESLQPFGNGLINDTYVATTNANGLSRRYILQRINHHVFKDPCALMHNVERVCCHIAKRLQEETATTDPSPRTLNLVQTRDGKALHHHHSPTGISYWRCYDFIEDSISHDHIESPRHAYQAARKFGEFQRLVTDIGGERLTETIPGFHHTPQRFKQLTEAVKEDPFGRVKTCREAIDFALSHHAVANRLATLQADGLIPERVTHNDTKLSNVLLDKQSGEGVCVVDLDTVMPGLSLHDFGDLVRSCVSPVAEDSTELDKITVRMDIFESLAAGFLDEMAGILTQAEVSHLGFSGKLLAYELGLRFLTDYLLGDAYFGAKHPNHNLDRARNQFRLMSQLDSSKPQLDAFITDYLKSSHRQQKNYRRAI